MSTSVEPRCVAGSVASVPDRICHWIDGELCGSVSGATFEVLEPASNTVYATAAAGGVEDIDRAVLAAGAVFSAGTWADAPPRRRASVLMAVADSIEARNDLLVAYETFDTGLPVSQAKGQAARAAENFRFFADVIVDLGEEAYRSRSQLAYVLRRAAGVAGLITPWNTPFMLETWKLAPALASGCSVVLKPAEWTPLSASLLPQIMEEAGLPRGVLNIVHGIGEDAGAALVRHDGVPLLSFTGETITGQTIMREAAANLKGLSMELGGKSPCIVFTDADIDAALDSALFGVFSLNGERCTAGSRILVQRPIYEDFVAALGTRASQIIVGDPSDPATEIGPLAHRDHLARVLSYVDAGLAEGARLVAGGRRPEGLESGNYLEATVFADVKADMRIFQEEIFGPVVCVTPFDSEDEAVELANATRYGLAGYIWTNDLKRGHRMANSIDAGMLWLNSHNIRDLRTPFGGVRSSGLGREGGFRSIDFYTEPRVVHVAVGDTHVPRFGIHNGTDANG